MIKKMKHTFPTPSSSPWYKVKLSTSPHLPKYSSNPHLLLLQLPCSFDHSPLPLHPLHPSPIWDFITEGCCHLTTTVNSSAMRKKSLVHQTAKIASKTALNFHLLWVKPSTKPPPTWSSVSQSWLQFSSPCAAMLSTSSSSPHGTGGGGGEEQQP